MSRLLAAELHFNPEDVAENRAGRLAPRQFSALAFAYLAFFALTVLFPIAFFIRISKLASAPSNS